MRPLAIDLFCGLGGWTEGLLAEGYQVIGFDNERHVYGDARYPAQLVIQDVLTLHGRQFKDAALIVASPPCQAYSYRAMPWKRAKALPPPDNTLFEACFRIQREACEAAGRHIPLVVENVCGAQKWVGRARWHFGSFFLWGDVPALMPIVGRRGMKGSVGTVNGSGKHREQSSWDHADGIRRINEAHRSKSPEKGYGAVDQDTGRKHGGDCFSDPSWPGKQGGVKRNTIANAAEGCKQKGSGAAWFRGEHGMMSSKSSARKAASAHIAKIPLALAQHIARAWKPIEAEAPSPAPKE